MNARIFSLRDRINTLKALSTISVAASFEENNKSFHQTVEDWCTHALTYLNQNVYAFSHFIGQTDEETLVIDQIEDDYHYIMNTIAGSKASSKERSEATIIIKFGMCQLQALAA